MEGRAISASFVGRCPAMLLFDFLAAFPNVARQFLWAVLRKLGVTEYIVHAIQMLYVGSDHILLFCGVSQFKVK
eukprot:5454058-Alexandrium_andersonii.AAC.1